MNHFTTLTFFGRGNSIYMFLFIFFFWGSSCTSNKSSCEFPELLFEIEEDTLGIGDILKVKIWLSDTSYFNVMDQRTQEVRRIYPLFKINGKIVDNNFSDLYIYTDTVRRDIEYEKYPKLRDVKCSILFPHPSGFGHVEITKLVNYVIIHNE